MSGVHLRSVAPKVARRLAESAEAVCRHYLFNGCRTGRYWHVGDVMNSPGQSLYVRLSGSRSGKWVDAATGEHGDLLDLIVLNQNLPSLKDALDEACRFLALGPEHLAEPQPLRPRLQSAALATRLFARARPITNTVAETYLRIRGISIAPQELTALRFHPACFYRRDSAAPRQALPALIAAVTDLNGRITGIERTWLDAAGSAKASLPMPRRALGSLLGHGVRFGSMGKVLLAGEGLETVLSLKSIMPGMPMVAALSASRLAALVLPPTLTRLYVACDADAAGRRALERLRQRAQAEAFDIVPLLPTHGDFNDDLRALGPSVLAAAMRQQMPSADRAHLDHHQSA